MFGIRQGECQLPCTRVYSRTLVVFRCQQFFNKYSECWISMWVLSNSLWWFECLLNDFSTRLVKSFDFSFQLTWLHDCLHATILVLQYSGSMLLQSRYRYRYTDSHHTTTHTDNFSGSFHFSTFLLCFYSFITIA